MKPVQLEYLRNAQKAVRIAAAVKFSEGAYRQQVTRALECWARYLRSVEARSAKERASHLRILLASKDTDAALKFLS
jgi:hypothetical protein